MEHTPKKNVNPNHKKTKGRICELPNEVGMSHLGEALDSHTQQPEVHNQL